MANGSFGLSGFPTAPTTTSTGGGTNNALTPVTVAVNSVAGFSSGSLVYNRNGDYANPVTSTSSATFPITVAAPILNSVSAPTWLATTSTASGDCCVIANSGPVTGFSYAATLTSGNIVVVYKIQATGNSAFRIVDENYTEVVAQITVTGVGQSGFNNVGVIALTGGGFVIYSINGSSQPVFAIYNNAGTLVTAATTDTTYTFNAYFLQAVPRPDGSWILYGVEGGATSFVYKVFSATGTQVYAWTSIGTTNGGAGQVTIAVRSDNSFVLAWYIVTTNLLTYAVRSATNVATVAPTSTGVGSGANLPISSVCLSTNAVVFVYQSGSGQPITARTLSSANVLGSAVTLFAYDGVTYFANPTHYDVYLLDSDNYVVALQNTASSRYSQNTVYFVASSAGVILSGANPLVLLNTIGNTGSQNWNVFVRTTNYIHNINSMIFSLNVSSATANIPCVLIGTRISPTTYKVVPNQSSTQTMGNTAAQPVSAYAPGNSSTTGAAFYASTSGLLTTTVANTTGTITAGTTIEAFTTDTMDACPLSNGGVAIMYWQASSGTVKIAIYNVSMVLQTTISFLTGHAAGVGGMYKITQLSNGKLLVAYRTGGSTLAFKVYSTSYALLTTFSAVPVNFSIGGMVENIAIAPLSGGRFVLAALVSNQPHYAIYTDTGTNSVSSTLVLATSAQSVTVTNTPIGFTYSFNNTGTSVQNMYSYYEAVDQSNSFTQGGVLNSGAMGTTFDIKAVAAANGSALIPRTSTTTGLLATVGTLRGTLNNSEVITGTTITAGTYATPDSFPVAGAPCAGGRVHAAVTMAGKTLKYIYQSGAASGSGTVTTLTISDMTSTNSYGGFRLVGLYGTVMIFTYITTSQYPAFTIINVDSQPYDITLVAGTTASNPSQTLAPSTGYYLLGVAASDCPAKGSGNVTINGSATLNSNYPATATAQSFDFSSPVTFGAKGTQLNRNVNLQGNV
jgi:hypothetical protein